MPWGPGHYSIFQLPLGHWTIHVFFQSWYHSAHFTNHLVCFFCHPPNFSIVLWDPWAPSPSSVQPHSHASSDFQLFPTLVTPWPTTHQPPEALVTALGWVGGYPLVLFWPSSALPGCLNYQSGCLSHPFLFGQFNHAHPLQTPRAPLAISPHTGMLVDQ